MSYMRSTDSAVLQEFGRIMEEKEQLKKVAQAAVVPLSDEEKAKLQHFLGELQKFPSNGPGMERWMNRLKGQADASLKAVYDSLSQRHALWAMGKDAQELAAVPLPSMDQGMAVAPPQAAPPMAGNAAPVHTGAAISAREKVADQKAYDVTGKEDMVQEAHPNKAMVEGELVENLNEQQDADKAVAEKSAKDILAALYKLAKRLKAENNETAFELVKETFLDLSNSFRK